MFYSLSLMRGNKSVSNQSAQSVYTINPNLNAAEVVEKMRALEDYLYKNFSLGRQTWFSNKHIEDINQYLIKNIEEHRSELRDKLEEILKLLLKRKDQEGSEDEILLLLESLQANRLTPYKFKQELERIINSIPKAEFNTPYARMLKAGAAAVSEVFLLEQTALDKTSSAEAEAQRGIFSEEVQESFMIGVLSVAVFLLLGDSLAAIVTVFAVLYTALQLYNYMYTDPRKISLFDQTRTVESIISDIGDSLDKHNKQHAPKYSS